MSHHSYLASPGGALWDGGQQMCITIHKTITGIITLSHMHILYMGNDRKKETEKNKRLK